MARGETVPELGRDCFGQRVHESVVRGALLDTESSDETEAASHSRTGRDRGSSISRLPGRPRLRHGR